MIGAVMNNPLSQLLQEYPQYLAWAVAGGYFFYLLWRARRQSPNSWLAVVEAIALAMNVFSPIWAGIELIGVGQSIRHPFGPITNTSHTVVVLMGITALGAIFFVNPLQPKTLAAKLFAATGMVGVISVGCYCVAYAKSMPLSVTITAWSLAQNALDIFTLCMAASVVVLVVTFVRGFKNTSHKTS